MKSFDFKNEVLTNNNHYSGLLFLSKGLRMLTANCKLPIFKEGGLAQLARAPALHAGGHRFDSDILHFFKLGRWFGKVDNDYKMYCLRQ